MKAVLPALARPLLESRLPAELEVAWFSDHDEANAMIVDADIAWVDQQRPAWTGEAVARGEGFRAIRHDPGRARRSRRRGDGWRSAWVGLETRALTVSPDCLSGDQPSRIPAMP